MSMLKGLQHRIADCPGFWKWAALPVAAIAVLGGAGQASSSIAPAGVSQPSVVEEEPAPAASLASASIIPGVSAPRVVEGSFWSASLNRNMAMAVYLPRAYEGGTDLLPVLYILHGLGGSHNDWQRWGLFDVATRLMDTGQIPPMIIVAPDGESGYWIDAFNGGPRFGSYVSKDLVGYVDSHYRTVADGSLRAIGGMSMGAHGALQLALNNPGEFSIVGAHSLVLRTKQQAFPIFGDQQYFERYDPVSIIAKSPDRARGLTLWIDIGRSDSWSKAANAFHTQLQAQSISHVWHIWEGGHDAAYCSSHLADYLRYYGDAFASAQKSLPHDW